jgi:hypothetical protein
VANSVDVEVRPLATNGSAPAGRLILQSPLTILGIILVLVGSLIAVGRGASAFFWVVIFGSGLFAAICIHYRLYLDNASLYVRSGKLGITDFLGRHREMPLGAAEAIRLCSVTSNAGIQPYLLGMSREGRCVFTIASADHYSLADIRRVASAAAIPILGSWNDRGPLNEMNQRYPGALGTTGRLIADDFRQGTVGWRLAKYGLAILLVCGAVAIALRSQGLLH